MSWVNRYVMSVTDDHPYIPFVVIKYRYVIVLISGTLTLVIRRVPLVGNELFAFPEHLSVLRPLIRWF